MTAAAELSVLDRVPHRPPLLLIDTLRTVSDQGCIAQVRVDPAAWYAQADGAMGAWFGLELMAQTAAAFNGHGASAGAPPAVGYLLGTREYRCSVPQFPAGAVLDVEVRVLYPETFGQSAMDCEIRHLGMPVANGTLKFLVMK
jgi:predicted hotdog family 3-hydroxylacyl-ACP dehydratase